MVAGLEIQNVNVILDMSSMENIAKVKHLVLVLSRRFQLKSDFTFSQT